MSLPIFASIPPLTASSACYAAGYAVGAGAFAWMASRRRMWTTGMASVLAVGLVAGLACANLAQWAFAHETGKSVLGAVAGGYFAVALYKRWLGLRRGTGDLFAVAISAGEAVGRFGCYFGGCCYGKAAHVPWAVWQHGEWRHPTQLYLAAAAAAILAVLLRVERAKPPENTLFYLQGVLYCTARFVIEFFRETNVSALGLSTAQWACAGGALFFGAMLARLLRRQRAAAVGIRVAA